MKTRNIGRLTALLFTVCLLCSQLAVAPAGSMEVSSLEDGNYMYEYYLLKLPVEARISVEAESLLHLIQ